MPIGTPSVPYRLPGSQLERWVDIYTRLGAERILFLGQEVNDGIANSLVAQMLYLDSEDSSKPIYLYINSPGGSVTAGLAIYDTMKQVTPDVVTICYGLAASMGAFLLSGGSKGIGRSIVLKFAKMNFDIITCSRNLDDLNKLKIDVEKLSKTVSINFIKADLSKEKDCQNFINYVKSFERNLDLLVNNVGIFSPGKIYNED